VDAITKIPFGVTLNGYFDEINLYDLQVFSVAGSWNSLNKSF
jgi:hypothetical protein